MDEKGVSCWACPGLCKGEEPVNRCSGGSDVRVEIQASSSTVSSSRAANSSVTSSPTPSISAIAAKVSTAHTPVGRGRSLASGIYTHFLFT